MELAGMVETLWELRDENRGASRTETPKSSSIEEQPNGRIMHTLVTNIVQNNTLLLYNS
jgi:hypothetical protein